MGLSFGPQLGASKVDHVIIIPSSEALQSFLGAFAYPNTLPLHSLCAAITHNFHVTILFGIHSITGKGQISIKGDTQLTVGKIGRDAQIGVAVSNEGNVAPVTSYSFGAKGLYGGLSIGSMVLAPRNVCNREFYGFDINLKDITSGHIEAPLLNEDYKRIVELLNVHQILNEHQDPLNANPFMAPPADQHMRYEPMNRADDPGFQYQAFSPPQ